MATKQTLSIVVMVLLIAALSTHSLCQSSSRRSLIGRDPQRWFNMTKEEQRKAREEDRFQRKQEELKRAEPERIRQTIEAWTRLLRVTKQQWKRIEPTYTSILNLCGVKGEEMRGAYSFGQHKDGSRPADEASEFRWGKYAEMNGALAPTLDEMTEGQRAVDELIDLLEDDNANDQAIRTKIDALQQARAKARQEIPQAKLALRSILTTRRQEAVFLLMGLID